MTALQAHRAAAIAVFLLLDEEEEEKKSKVSVKRKRQVWVREWIAKRERSGVFANLLTEVRSEDPAVYQNFVRMSAEDFDFLLSIVNPLIRKKDTLMRKSISSAERLAITLRYLATGDSFHSLMYLFRVPVCTISKIIAEVCSAIYSALKNEYLQTPTSTRKWEEIAKTFEKKWNFPNCIGALDGKHVIIKKPPHTGSLYFNYKKCYSVVLMALVDPEYKILYVNVGGNGRNSDAGIFNRCSLAKAIEGGLLNIPQDRTLPNGLQPVPYVIVTDEGFAMRRYSLRPYSQRNLRGSERIFNYRLSRARRLSENVFGIMSARFRVLRHQIELGPERTTTVVLAICALHNFLMTRSSSNNFYATSSDFDRENEGVVIEGQWRNENNFLNGTSLLPLATTVSDNSYNSNQCKDTREIFKNYFMTDGEVPWQYKHL